VDRRVKNEGVHDRLGKRAYDQNWASHDEERVCLARGPIVFKRSNKELEKNSPPIEE
jgi:hypothetical protein